MSVPCALQDLPPVPDGLTGWPWKIEESAIPCSGMNSNDWPRITVVTPSYNQGRFLEATIRSVILQGYPNLEYVVIDGGSTDKSLDIIHRYDRWIDYWVSEADRGQSEAINKGLGRATGDVLAWLNSDDMYALRALWTVGEAFRYRECDVVSGHSLFVDENGGLERRFAASPIDVSRLLRVRGGFTAPQQSTFWSRACWERHGPLSEDLHYVMDYEFWIKMAAAAEKWDFIDRELSLFRHHAAQKTADIPSNLLMLAERRTVLERFRSSDLCTIGLRRDVRRGLREIQVKELRIRYQRKQSNTSFWRYWLKAAFRNPGCLYIPSFYGLALRGPRRLPKVRKPRFHQAGQE